MGTPSRARWLPCPPTCHAPPPPAPPPPPVPPHPRLGAPTKPTGPPLAQKASQPPLCPWDNGAGCRSQPLQAQRATPPINSIELQSSLPPPGGPIREWPCRQSQPRPPDRGTPLPTSTAAQRGLFRGCRYSRSRRAALLHTRAAPPPPPPPAGAPRRPAPPPSPGRSAAKSRQRLVLDCTYAEVHIQGRARRIPGRRRAAERRHPVKRGGVQSHPVGRRGGGDYWRGGGAGGGVGGARTPLPTQYKWVRRLPACRSPRRPSVCSDHSSHCHTKESAIIMSPRHTGFPTLPPLILFHPPLPHVPLPFPQPPAAPNDQHGRPLDLVRRCRGNHLVPGSGRPRPRVGNGAVPRLLLGQHPPGRLSRRGLYL